MLPHTSISGAHVDAQPAPPLDRPKSYVKANMM